MGLNSLDFDLSSSFGWWLGIHFLSFFNILKDILFDDDFLDIMYFPWILTTMQLMLYVFFLQFLEIQVLKYFGIQFTWNKGP